MKSPKLKYALLGLIAFAILGGDLVAALVL